MILDYNLKINTISKKVTKIALEKIKEWPEIFLADDTIFLEMCGFVAIGWMWTNQAKISSEKLEIDGGDRNFYLGKIETARYFIEYEFIKITSLSERFSTNSYPTINMKKEWF